MMIYRRQPREIEAWQILTTDQAAIVTGHQSDTPGPGEDWAIRWAGAGGVELHLGGRYGDLLTRAGDSWRLIREAEFEAEWERPPIDNLGGIRDSVLR